jgi:hypothetical protein
MKPKKEEKRVRAMPVNMRCPRCQHVTFIVLPVGNPACPHCGRPWFWPFAPICKENEAWAREYVAKVESTFKPILAPIPLKEIFDKAEEIDAAYKSFIGAFKPDRKLPQQEVK